MRWYWLLLCWYYNIYCVIIISFAFRQCAGHYSFRMCHTHVACIFIYIRCLQCDWYASMGSEYSHSVGWRVRCHVVYRGRRSTINWVMSTYWVCVVCSSHQAVFLHVYTQHVNQCPWRFFNHSNRATSLQVRTGWSQNYETQILHYFYAVKVHYAIMSAHWMRQARDTHTHSVQEIEQIDVSTQLLIVYNWYILAILPPVYTTD